MVFSHAPQNETDTGFHYDRICYTLLSYQYYAASGAWTNAEVDAADQQATNLRLAILQAGEGVL
ncbi:MAG: hypothetical protein O3C68_08570 [Proteobacteria bacterium]|nr:hypothetical protein [Pseudomonadota bacterium]